MDIEEARPTIATVARAAGVSIATASRSLNGREDVHPDTRRRVLDAAEALNFSLRRRTTKPDDGGRDTSRRTVGLLTADPAGRFSMGILNGAEDAFGAGETGVFLCSSRNDPIREQHYIATLLERRIDGLIVIGDTTNYRASIGSKLPIPTVYAFSSSDDPNDVSHVPDDVLGAQMAVDHLLSLGRTRIAHITGPRNYLSASERTLGVTRALEAAGLSLVSEPLYGSWWTQQWGRTAAHMLMASSKEVDAIVCGNDQIAVGVMDTLRELGRNVPSEISVIGYDNWTLFAEEAQTPLTTIDMDLETIGREAARALFRAMDSDYSPGRHLHPPHLVIRESTSAVSLG